MADLKDLTVERFAEITASDAPAPGGGSVSAMAASIGAALAEMVANLTIGKAKYADVEGEMKALSVTSSFLNQITSHKAQNSSFSSTEAALW